MVDGFVEKQLNNYLIMRGKSSGLVSTREESKIENDSLKTIRNHVNFYLYEKK